MSDIKFSLGPDEEIAEESFEDDDEFWESDDFDDDPEFDDEECDDEECDD